MTQTKEVLLLIALAVAYTDATYIAVAGGYCMTYDSKPLNTLIQLERCKVGDSKQSSWRIVPAGALNLVCISDDICDNVAAADHKKYLVKKNVNDVSQQWTFKPDRTCTNGLTGPKMCAELVYKLRIVPDHIAMKPCSNSPNQKFIGLKSDKELADHLKTNQ